MGPLAAARVLHQCPPGYGAPEAAAAHPRQTSSPASAVAAGKATGDADLPAQRGARIYAEALVNAGGRALQAPGGPSARESPHAVLYTSPPYALSVPALPVARLAFNLTRSRVSGGVEGDEPRSFDARRHALFLTRAGDPVTWRRESPSRHLSVYFDQALLDGSREGGLRLAELPTLFNAAVPGLSELVDELVGELQAPGMMSGEAADSLGRLVLIRLARHLNRSPTVSGVLSPAALTRLRDYVAVHIGDRILVADLAREAGLSPNRFAVAFTLLAGQPPHRFVLAMRIERASELLATSTCGLAEIAHGCGFASQQHLSNAFRRHFGTTPSRYRELRRR